MKSQLLKLRRPLFEADLPWEKLKDLSNDQLNEILKPYYEVTRPELVVKPSKAINNSKQMLFNLTPQQQEALKLMEEKGIDVSLIMKSFAKKR